YYVFFFSSYRRHTSFSRDWSSDVCLPIFGALSGRRPAVGGSQFGATALPASTAGRANRADRPVAAAADDGGGHCPHSWSGPLYGGARAAPAGSEPPGLARAQAAGDPLRAREAG